MWTEAVEFELSNVLVVSVEWAGCLDGPGGGGSFLVQSHREGTGVSAKTKRHDTRLFFSFFVDRRRASLRLMWRLWERAGQRGAFEGYNLLLLLLLLLLFQSQNSLTSIKSCSMGSAKSTCLQPPSRL